MTRSELWSAYTAKNPAFAGGGNITMSAEGLRKLFNQTWDKAEEHGRAMAAASGGGGKSGGSVFDEIFGGGFGKKKP